MEFVKDKEMYMIVQDTEFNRKYHNYRLNDMCDCSKQHNSKYASYKKAKRKDAQCNNWTSFCNFWVVLNNLKV